MLHLFRRSRPHEPPKPRQQERQIAPADGERPERIEQPPRNLRQHAGHRHRNHRRAIEPAGVTERGALAGTAGIEDEHLATILLKEACAGDPDRTGTDHDHRRAVVAVSVVHAISLATPTVIDASSAASHARPTRRVRSYRRRTPTRRDLAPVRRRPEFWRGSPPGRPTDPAPRRSPTPPARFRACEAGARTATRPPSRGCREISAPYHASTCRGRWAGRRRSCRSEYRRRRGTRSPRRRPTPARAQFLRRFRGRRFRARLAWLAQVTLAPVR